MATAASRGGHFSPSPERHCPGEGASPPVESGVIVVYKILLTFDFWAAVLCYLLKRDKLLNEVDRVRGDVAMVIKLILCLS